MQQELAARIMGCAELILKAEPQLTLVILAILPKMFRQPNRSVQCANCILPPARGGGRERGGPGKCISRQWAPTPAAVYERLDYHYPQYTCLCLLAGVDIVAASSSKPISIPLVDEVGKALCSGSKICMGTTSSLG